MTLDELVFQHRNLKISLPRELKNIFNAIEESKFLFGSDETWKDLMEFLANYSKHIYKKNKIIITTPYINDEGMPLHLLFQDTKKIYGGMCLEILYKNEKKILSYYGDNFGPNAEPTTKKEKETIIEEDIDYNPNKIHTPLANWMKKYLDSKRIILKIQD